VKSIRFLASIVVLAAAPAILMTLIPGRANGQSQEAEQVPFDPHDLSGVWWVDQPGPDVIFARAKNGDAGKCQTCHPSEHAVPEPPLTAWARENLVFAGDRFHGTLEKPAGSAFPSAISKRNNCDPIAVPAQFWYTQLYPFEFVVTADRILQFFEKQNEWRVIWMKRGHPKDVQPTYMGDSVGKWEGDTLVVDTTGYNGKDLIEPAGVDHLMSDSFHLLERWRRTSSGKMDLEVTYYDPKVWGDKPWGGLKKQFLLQRNLQLMEAFCTAEDNARFDEFVKPLLPPPGK